MVLSIQCWSVLARVSDPFMKVFVQLTASSFVTVLHSLILSSELFCTSDSQCSEVLSGNPQGQNGAWVKHLFKVPEKTMDCNIRDCRKFIDVVLHSTWPLTFTEAPRVECWCSMKEEYSELSEKA